MEDQIYRKLMQKFAQRGGRYPGTDIPEFFEMARALFSPEEASVAAVMPKGFSTAEQLAQASDRNEDDLLLLDLDRCFGCGVCATSCPTEAVTLVERAGVPEPPVDQKALREAFKSAAAAS